jgi:hypothetical protein
VQGESSPTKAAGGLLMCAGFADESASVGDIRRAQSGADLGPMADRPLPRSPNTKRGHVSSCTEVWDRPAPDIHSRILREQNGPLGYRVAPLGGTAFIVGRFCQLDRVPLAFRRLCRMGEKS